MITTFFLFIFNAFVSFLLSFLPTGSLPTALTDSFMYFWSVVNSFSYIFPVSTLLLALLFILAFDAAVMLWHFIQWIIKKIPGLH